MASSVMIESIAASLLVMTGVAHFETLYKPIVSEWLLYDNVGEEPVLLASGENP
jgi:hypothetical protein